MKPDLRPQVRRLLVEPKTTVVVADLRALAESGGVLDDLSAAGYRIQGPKWRN